MAMAKCRECGAEVSDSAKACPQCGAREPSTPQWQMALGAVALLAIVGGVATCAFSSNTSTTTSAAAPEAVAAPESAAQSDAFTAPVVLTRAAYDAISDGASIAEVERQIGRPADQMTESTTLGVRSATYLWTEDDGSVVIAIFENGRLISKSQTGLR